MDAYRRGPTPDLVAAMPDGTEEKLRGMRCTADQRKNLMRAAKLGLGPLKQLGISSSPPVGPSRSRSPRRQPVLASAGGSSSSRAAVPAAPGAGRSALKAQADDDDEDLSSFLAGGKAMAQRAARAAAAARERAGRHAEPQAPAAPRAAEPPPPQPQAAQATVAVPAAATAERERLEAENRERENRRQEEEHRRLEEERQQEERRRARQEEKRKRREEKAKRRAPSPQDDMSEDDEAAGADSSEDRDRSRPTKSQGGVFKKAFRADGSQRQHWGESVKGRVSNDYKGFTDADLDRRFGLPGQQSNEKLMTEEQVLAMLRSGRGPKG